MKKRRYVLLVMISVVVTFVCLTAVCGEKKEKETGKDTVADNAKKNGPEPSAKSKKKITNSIGMKFKLIEAGEFMMGSEKGAPDEKPVHKVKITKPFYIGVYEVTQSQYEKIMGKNPSEFKGPNRPVQSVSWADAVLFCKKLSGKEGVKCRLPSEAEWEYACRAGTRTEHYWGNEMDGRYAWYSRNSDFTTHDVGQKKPNAWGLYDMSGNVWEWCSDEYDKDYYSLSPTSNPRGPAGRKSLYNVLRGGSWVGTPRFCRSASRFRYGSIFPSNRFGFRIVRAAD